MRRNPRRAYDKDGREIKPATVGSERAKGFTRAEIWCNPCTRFAEISLNDLPDAMPFPPENPPRVFSVVAGREVSTWSEEWKHEYEVRFLAGTSLADRNRTLDGEKDGLKGMKTFRGEAAVAHLRAEIERYAALSARPIPPTS